MKVLLATQQVIPHEGGLSTHMVDLAAGLERLGHEVRLIHGGQASGSGLARIGRMAASLGDLDRYVCWSMGALLRRLGGLLLREIEAFAPDLVHCHDPYAAATVAGVIGSGSPPVVETVHGPALYEAQMGNSIRGPRHRNFILDCEQRAFAAARRLIAVDSGQAAILRNDYGVDGSRITVIFNCVNVAEVRRLAAADSPLRPVEPFFLVPRRLVPKTGVRYAIEALARMQQTNVRLVIAGQGPLRGELEALANSLGLAGRTRFLGSVPRAQLLPLFPRAAAVIVPSVPESGVVEATSLAVTEAMAAGTIPIASNIGGLAELIQNEQTGLLVPPADPGALAAAMAKALGDSPLRRRLLGGAKEKVEADYDTHAWLEKTIAVYRQALAEARN